MQVLVLFSGCTFNAGCPLAQRHSGIFTNLDTQVNYLLGLKCLIQILSTLLCYYKNLPLAIINTYF